MDLEHFLMKFPVSWRTLFGTMCVNERPLYAATVWLEHELSSKFGNSLNFRELLQSLICEEPNLGKDGGLIFQPRLLHFPLPIQRTLTAFLVHNVHRITKSCLHDFVQTFTMQTNISRDEWVKANIRMLKERCGARNCKICGGDGSGSYVFSQQMSNYASEIMDRLTGQTGIVPASPMECNDEADELVTSESMTHYTSPCDSQPPIKRLKSFPSSQNYSLLVSSQDEPETGLSSSQFYLTPTQLPKQQLTQEMLVTISRLKDWLHSPPSSIDETCDDVSVFNQCPVGQLDKVCEMLELDHVTEVAMAAACHNVVSLEPEIGYSCCLCFAKHCILPKVVEITQSASRLLTGSLTSLTQKFPRPLIEAVFKECITSICFNTAQSELLCRLVKDVLSGDERVFLLSCSLQDLPTMEESHVSLLQSLVDCKVEMSEQVLDEFITHLEHNSLNMAESKKFGKLLLAVIKQYGNQITKSNQSSLSNVIRCLRSFLKKTCETALSKLQSP